MYSSVKGALEEAEEQCIKVHRRRRDIGLPDIRPQSRRNVTDIKSSQRLRRASIEEESCLEWFLEQVVWSFPVSCVTMFSL